MAAGNYAGDRSFLLFLGFLRDCDSRRQDQASLAANAKTGARMCAELASMTRPE
ncbi:MAG: hypothetical protein WA763_24915 [Pseudolabrys sp.]